MSEPIHTLSFVCEGHYHAAPISGLTPAQADALHTRLTHDHERLAYADRVQDLQVIQNVPIEGSAAELIDTIATALNIHLETVAQQVEANDPTVETGAIELLALYRRAQALDMGADDPERVAFGLDFVWENGGGDDNAFGQSFTVAPGQQEAAWSMLEDLADWIEASGSGYDVNPGMGDDQEGLPLAEALDDLATTLEDNDYGTFATVLRNAAVPDAAPNVVPPTPAPAARRPRPR